MGKYGLHQIRHILAIAAMCSPFWLYSSVTAQELPPEPNMEDLFNDLDAPIDLEEDAAIAEPPPLPQSDDTITGETIPSEPNISEDVVLDPPANETIDDIIVDMPSEPLETEIEAETLTPEPEQFSEEPLELNQNNDFPTPNDFTAPLAESPNSNTLSNTSLTNDEEDAYRTLRAALYEFLGTAQPSNVQSSSQKAPAVINKAPAVIDEVIEPQTTPAPAEDDLFADIPLEGEPLTEPEPAIQPTENTTLPLRSQTAEASSTQSEPEANQAPQATTDNNVITENSPKQKAPKLPVVAQDEVEKAPELPAFDAEEKEYLQGLEQQSDALPKFVQIPDKEKKTLEKPLEELARAQKEADRKNALPPEEYELSHGEDLSAIAENDSGRTYSDKGYDLSMTNDDKTDKFLSTDIQLEMAYRALLSGQLEAAIDIYKSIMEKHPSNQNAMFGLASAYQKNQQYEQATLLYSELLEAVPNHKEALNNYLVIMTQEAPEDALLQLQKLERVSPYYSPIPAQIGMVYYRLGQYVQAERYLRKAISMAPDNLSFLYNLAIISDHLGKTEQSIALYERLMEESKKGLALPGSTEQISERLHYLRQKVL